MNANLLPKTPAINDWIRQATKQLVDADIPSPRLDAEILLAHTLRKSRTFLHAHGDEILSDRQLEIANARLLLRIDRTPVAYIIGHKEFYGRKFRVTPATLIPRPESETIISIVKELTPPQPSLLPRSTIRIVDVGTGSGCLGITIKLEIPDSDVSLLDISKHALHIAKMNADQLQADVELVHSNLLSNYPFTANIIVANLPYVDSDWERSPETNYEPEIALFADDDGLSLIRKLLPLAAPRLVTNGALLLEADPRQHDAIITEAKHSGFRLIETRGFIIHLQKTS